MPGPFGKIFRTDPDEMHLFVCTFFNEIQVHFGVGNAEFSQILPISQIPGKGIVDYVVLNEDLLLVYTSDCLAIIYEYTISGANLVYLNKHEMGGDHGINLSSDSSRSKVILSSQKDLHMGVLKIFTVDYSCKSLTLLQQLDMTKQNLPADIQSPDHYLYFVKDWNMDLRVDDCPVILGLQFKSNQLMLCLKLNPKGELEVVKDSFEVERDIFHSSEYHNHAVWTIDRDGRIFKVEIAD